MHFVGGSEFSLLGGKNRAFQFILQIYEQIWQCGGTLEIIPCSHVGHVFRDKSPYTFPGGVAKIVNKNAARVAETWMDEWKNFYYQMNPGISNKTYCSILGIFPYYSMMAFAKSSVFTGQILFL